ncbi:MAG TPA: glycosyltransferase [Acetobacteraceae bacterium]|jgi:glycosyltransferase involved in cell wall biosynthesis|nr:glycosyltransferase [Acetobacteraceae bacterium]
MRDPRVCILAHAHPDFSKGGGELAAFRQFATLRDAGQDPVLVAALETVDWGGTRPALPGLMPHAPGEHVFPLDGMAPDRLGWENGRQRAELVTFLAGLGVGVYHLHHYWRLGLDLISDLMEARPDALFVLTLHEMLAICMNHGQMVRTGSRELCQRDSPLRCLSCFPDRGLDHIALRKAAMLATLRRFDRLIYPSAFLRDRYEAWGLAGQPAFVLENYLGDRLAALPRAEASSPALARRFGFFGQPTPTKGLDVLLQALPLALREERRITLTVHGCAQEEALRLFPHLAGAIEAAGRSLAFLGRYDPDDAVRLMRGVGWVVVPSIWWENSPTVIQEARRAGTPLIVSDIGGMAEKVQEGVDGLHAQRGSPMDLARAMVEAAQPATRARIGGTVRDVIGRDAFLAGLCQVYARPGLQAAAE